MSEPLTVEISSHPVEVQIVVSSAPSIQIVPPAPVVLEIPEGAASSDDVSRLQSDLNHHENGIDPHPQYALRSLLDELMGNVITAENLTTALHALLEAADPFPQYIKAEELVNGLADKVEESDLEAVIAALQGKAPSVHTHEISAVNGLEAALEAKAPSAALVAVATALTDKASAEHGHPISNISGLQEALSDRPVASTVSGAISQAVSQAIASHEEAVNPHAVYATDADLAAGLDTKAPTQHGHQIDAIQNLQSTLDALQTSINASASAGSSGQYLATRLTSTVVVSAVIPVDDTLPQSNEGTQLFSVTITPKSSSSKLRIAAQTSFCCLSSGVNASIALFKDSEPDAIAVGCINTAGYQSFDNLQLVHIMASPGNASAITFSIRVGTSSSGNNLYINQSYGSNWGRRFGGAMAATLEIWEL